MKATAAQTIYVGNQVKRGDFEQLHPNGWNFLEWLPALQTNLRAKRLLKFTQEEYVPANLAELQKKKDPPATAEELEDAEYMDSKEAATLSYIQHHLHVQLKQQFNHIKQPKELLKSLAGRFNHTPAILKPRAEKAWQDLKFSDFATVESYNMRLYEIINTFAICGVSKTDSEILTKTLDTFHPTEFQISEGYRKDPNVKSYDQLLQMLYQAETRKSLLVERHQGNIGSTLIPKMHGPTIPASIDSHYANIPRNRHGNPGNLKNRQSPYNPRVSCKYCKKKGHTIDVCRKKAAADQRTSRPNGFNPKTPVQSQSKAACDKCGNPNHVTKDCKAGKHAISVWTTLKSRGLTTYHTELDSANMETEVLDFQDFSKPHTGPDLRHFLNAKRLVQSSSQSTGNFVTRDVEVENLELEANSLLYHINETMQPYSSRRLYLRDILMSNDETSCLVDSCSTHTVFNDARFFSSLTYRDTISCHTIGGKHTNFGVAFGPVHITLHKGTNVAVSNAVHAPSAKRNILSTSDLRRNNLGFLDIDDNMRIIRPEGSKITLLEETFLTNNELPAVIVKPTPTHGSPSSHITEMAIHSTSVNLPTHQLWHQRLGHISTSTIRHLQSTGSVVGLPSFKNPKDHVCRACAEGKLTHAPYSHKTEHAKTLQFMEHLCLDAHGPVNPPSGPYAHFLTIVEPTRGHLWVLLLQSPNEIYPAVLRKIIEFRTQYPENPIKTLHMDNYPTHESKAFVQFLQSLGIVILPSVDYAHQMNGQAESSIRRIQMTASPMLLQSNLPAAAWAQAVLHAAYLLNLRPRVRSNQSAMQLKTGHPIDISHLRTFGCAVWVPLPPKLQSKIGPKRRLGIYIGCESPSIIRYLEPMSGTSFRGRFQDCVFDENFFPHLGTQLPTDDERLLEWTSIQGQSIHSVDERCTIESERIINQFKLVQQAPGYFQNLPESMLQNQAVGAPPTTFTPASASAIRRKRTERDGYTVSKLQNAVHTTIPAGPSLNTASADAPVPVPKKRKGKNQPSRLNVNPTIADEPQSPPPSVNPTISDAPPSTSPANLSINPTIADEPPSTSPAIAGEPSTSPTIAREPPIRLRIRVPPQLTSHSAQPTHATQETNNFELAVFHTDMNDTDIWDRRNAKLNPVFCFNAAMQLMDEDLPRTFKEAMNMQDAPKWKEAVVTELKSLLKHTVFGNPQEADDLHTIVGTRWVFVRKRDAKGNITRWKARLTAQGFTQVWGQDYFETYSPVMDSTTFRYVISLAVKFALETRLMDVVTAYLYGQIDANISIKAPDGLHLVMNVPNLRRPVLKLYRSLYGLKQSGRNWYNRLRTYLIKNGFRTSQLTPCVFIKMDPKSGNLAIILVYVDDLNCIGTLSALTDVETILEKEFEMKKLGPTKFCIGIELEYVQNDDSIGILVHQAGFVTKLAQKFNVSADKRVTTPLLQRQLDFDQPIKDPYRPAATDEALVGSDIPYLSAIGCLIFLANTTRPDIAFATHLLARFSQAPTKRHWDGVHRIMKYLINSQDLGLYYNLKRDAVEDQVRLRLQYARSHHLPKEITTTDRVKAILVHRSSKDAFEHECATAQDFPEVEDMGVHTHRAHAAENIPSDVFDPSLSSSNIVGFADAGHNSSPTDSRAQNGYCFLNMGAAISWKSNLQFIPTTSSNWSENIALYEAVREGIWLFHLQKSICSNANLPFSSNPIIIFEDNKACIDQLAKGAIRGDKLKHIAPKFFFTHEVNGTFIQVVKIASQENVADIFTKTLAHDLHWKLVGFLGLRPLSSFRHRL